MEIGKRGREIRRRKGGMCSTLHLSLDSYVLLFSLKIVLIIRIDVAYAVTF